MMRRLLFLGLLACCIARVYAADAVDLEMAPVIERTKSRDAAERQTAVTELIGMRETVCDELRAIVSDANEARASDEAKASALFLMGKLRLAQCVDILEKEREWKWAPDRGISSDNDVYRYWMGKGQPALMYGSRANLRGPVSLAAARPRTALSACPSLLRALRELRSEDAWTARKAEDAVLKFYDVVGRSMYGVIKRRSVELYGDDVKITAIFLLGEFRSVHGSDGLEENIDMKDEKDQCAAYPATLTVQTPDRLYPATGRRTRNRKKP